MGDIFQNLLLLYQNVIRILSSDGLTAHEKVVQLPNQAHELLLAYGLRLAALRE